MQLRRRIAVERRAPGVVARRLALLGGEMGGAVFRMF